MKKSTSILLITIAIFSFIQYQMILTARIDYRHTKDKIVKAKADYVFRQIKAIRMEAIEQAYFLKNNIAKALKDHYNGDTVLIKAKLKEVYDNKSNGEILSVIGNQVKGVTLNGVSGNMSDNNDPIIYLKDLIVSDFSLNCSTDSRTRNVKQEQEHQFATQLYKQTADDISKMGNAHTIFHFLDVKQDKAWYDEVKNMTDTSLSNLKTIFVKYNGDIDFLSGFEFLSVMRINKYTDINGDPVITPQGVKNKKHMQISVVQGFNFIDQISYRENVKAQIKTYDTRLEDLNLIHIKSEMMVQLTLTISILLFLLLFYYKNERA